MPHLRTEIQASALAPEKPLAWLDAPTRFGGLSKFLRIERPSQLAFWILFAAMASLILFIRISNVFAYHPVFAAYGAVVGALIIARYVFFALYNPLSYCLTFTSPRLLRLFLPRMNQWGYTRRHALLPSRTIPAKS